MYTVNTSALQHITPRGQSVNQNIQDHTVAIANIAIAIAMHGFVLRV